MQINYINNISLKYVRFDEEYQHREHGVGEDADVEHELVEAIERE